ncbi:MAG: hypothetical protein ACJ761_06910 [Chloroflexota bacterium]
MAIVAAVFGALGRFAGRVLTTTLGWASTLLFGRVRRDRQVVLAAMTFGSVVWVALLAGVLVPDVGTILIGFVPVPDFIDEGWIRLAMLAGAIVLPLAVGFATLLFLDPARRPRGIGLVRHVLRGYPLTAALALILVFLAVVGVARKARVAAKRWSDVHIPLVVQPGHYDAVAADLERALDDGGLDVARGAAPRVLAMPARILATVAGAADLVPERLVMLTGREIEILLHQSDLAISGSAGAVARARAAIATRLVSTTAWMTSSPEAEAIEQQIQALARPSQPGGRPGAATDGADPARVAEQLKAIDAALASQVIASDEWEVLYRMRLQVERDLLAGNRPGEALPGTARARRTAERAGGERDGTGALDDTLAVGAAVGVAALFAVDALLLLRDRTEERS